MPRDIEEAKDKIRHEAECFRLDMLRTSRENIFAHSYEIEVKRQIGECLSRWLEDGRVDDAAAVRMNCTPSVIDAVYCIHESQRGLGAEEAAAIWMNPNGGVPDSGTKRPGQGSKALAGL